MDKQDRVTNLLVPVTLAILTAAVLWCYWPVLQKLFVDLVDNEDYSFGLLLPLVSGYIIYLKWPQIRNLLWRPSALGFLFIAAGFSLLIVGELAADLYIPRISLVLVITGLLFLVGGWALVRLLLFPLFLLVLMFPLPGLVTKQLTLPLQLISSRLATNFLQAVGIPAFCQGNIIDLGIRKMQIVEACSGLRYILALFALGVIFCYFYQRRPWKAATLMIIVLIPAAMVANVFRVMGMGIFPVLQQEGFWHVFSGWLIFIFCLGILVLINWLLNQLQSASAPKVVADEAKPASGVRVLIMETYLIAALALVLLGGPLATRASLAPAVELRQNFSSFPMALGAFEGRQVFIDPVMVKATQADAYLNAEFSIPGSPPVSLWIAYYGSQKKAGGFVHSPKLCLTGGGWTENNGGIDRLGQGMPVNYMIMEQMGNRMLVYYWYQQRGRWVTSEYLNKFYMGLDGLLRRRTDGALIRLITPVGSDLEAARSRLNSFAELLVPVLPQFIPN